MFPSIALILAIASSASATLCNPTDKFQVPNTSATIERRAEDQLGQTSLGAPITLPAIAVSGEVTILDGCRFSVSSFTFTGNPGSTYAWYGINLTNSTNGFPVTATPITTSSNANDVIFDLSTSAPSFSFADFNVLQVFDVTNDAIHAIVTLPKIAAGGATATVVTTPPTAKAPNNNAPTNNSPLPGFGSTTSVADTSDSIKAIAVGVSAVLGAVFAL